MVDCLVTYELGGKFNVDINLCKATRHRLVGKERRAGGTLRMARMALPHRIL